MACWWHVNSVTMKTTVCPQKRVPSLPFAELRGRSRCEQPVCASSCTSAEETKRLTTDVDGLETAGCPILALSHKPGCPVLARFWLGWGKFQERILCRPRGTPLSFPFHPPLKRWAIIFRARGARS